MNASTVSNSPALRRLGIINPVWLAVPAVVILIVFFVVPVIQLLVLSIKDATTSGFTLAHFERIFAQNVYIQVLLTTLRVSLATAVVCVVAGYPLAYWVAKMSPRRRALALLLIMVPFWTSYLVKTFAWMLVLGRMGVINQFLTSVGMDRIQLLNNETSVMIGMVHGMLPLAVLTLVPVMTSIDQRLVFAARTLGAPPARAFWLIYFRLSMPGVASAGLLTFLTSIGFFIVPALMGSPRETFLAQLIITQVQQVLDWGLRARFPFSTDCYGGGLLVLRQGLRHVELIRRCQREETQAQRTQCVKHGISGEVFHGRSIASPSH